MSNAAPLHLEIRMVGEDGWILRDLLTGPDRMTDFGQFALGIAPWCAFYVVEVEEWLKGLGAKVTSPLFHHHDSAIRSLRARFKLFDGERNGMEGVLDRLDEYERRSTAWFSHRHGGALGWLKRLLQPDLGLQFLGADLVCTTHISFANAAVGADDLDTWTGGDPFSYLGPHLHEFSRLMGQYMGAITDGMPTTRTPSAVTITAPAVAVPRVTYSDHKARTFYPGLQRRLGLPSAMAAAVTLVVAQTNFVHRWLRAYIPATNLFFRIRYLTVHHALVGLEKLNGRLRNDRASAAAAVCASILGSSDARAFRKLKRIRNAMAHYALPKAIRSSKPAAFADVVAALSGRRFEDIDALLDGLLETMSCSFRSLIAPDRTVRSFDADDAA